MPIPGTKRKSFLTENVAAVDVILSPSQLATLDGAVPADAVVGDRYSPQGMQNIGH